MFRTLNHRYFLPIICVLFLCNSGLSGQVPEHEIPKLRQQAMENFEEGDYADAETAFKQLIRQFPRDAMYRYYAGICLLEQGRNLDEAVELLYYASTRGVPEDVYYYLGEAYRKMYDFERAKKYFITFDKEAPRSMSREHDSKLLIRSVNTAMQVTSMYNPFEVQNVTFINLRDPRQTGQIRMKGGDLSVKPELFFSEDESRGDLNSLMFMPENVARGQKVYFAGPGRNGRDGFQIMQAKRGNTGKWTDIKPIDMLNTERDEILPYYDPVGKDIYFASNGREGLGGFDLFRSHYDEERDEWSEPVSLGFPVNSAFDDYLLLPGTDLGMVTFFSARQVSDTAVAVYRVHLSEPKQSLASKSPREIRSIANLGDVAADMIREYESYKELLADRNAGTSANTSRVSAEREDGKELADAGPMTRDDSRSTERSAEASAVVQPARAAAKENGDEQYEELISTALRHQAATDSLTELATAARVRVRESDDPNEKWLSQRQIMVWEKRASQEQEQADLFFARVAAYRQTTTPEVIEKDTVINDITVYRFADMQEGDVDQPERPDVEEKAKEVFAAGNPPQPGESTSGAQAPGTQSSGVQPSDAQLPAAPSQGAQPSGIQSTGTQPSGAELPGAQPSGAELPVAQPSGAQPSGSGTTGVSPEIRFEIRSIPSYSATHPVPVDVSLPRGTLYRIQLGVFSDQVDPAVFKGIFPVSAITDSARDLVFYYAGDFRRYDDARDAVELVRAEGFSDAFIVAWFNGARMSIEKARKLEK